jgi:Ca2+:H+ antiporter
MRPGSPTRPWWLTLVAGDGRSHWFKGVQLVAFYLILAAMFYLIPA